METNINKKAVAMLKEDIKKQVELQKSYKDQRKTVRFSGTRTMSPDEASWKHTLNREKLRRMYLAYGILREKDLDIIDQNYKDVGGYHDIAIEYEKKGVELTKKEPEKV